MQRPSKIRLYVTYPASESTVHAAVWDAEIAFTIRKKHRLLGDFCGTLPKHTSQNRYLSIPLVLSYEEIKLGLKRGFFEVVRDVPEYYDSVPTTVHKFWKEREREVDRQVEEAVEKMHGERRKRGLPVDEEVRVGQKRPRAEDIVAERAAKVQRVGLWHTLLRPVWWILSSFTGGNRDDEDTEPSSSDEPSDDGAPERTAERKLALHEERFRAQSKQTALIVTSTCARVDERLIEGTDTGWFPKPKGMSDAQAKAREMVFEDLYDRGYFMSCGAKFGADFLAYAGSPQMFHAGLAVVVVDADECIGARGVVALGRLGDSTRKRTVLAFVEDGEVQYVGVQWEETLP